MVETSSRKRSRAVSRVVVHAKADFPGEKNEPGHVSSFSEQYYFNYSRQRNTIPAFRPRRRPGSLTDRTTRARNALRQDHPAVGYLLFVGHFPVFEYLAREKTGWDNSEVKRLRWPGRFCVCVSSTTGNACTASRAFKRWQVRNTICDDRKITTRWSVVAVLVRQSNGMKII